MDVIEQFAYLLFLRLLAEQQNKSVQQGLHRMYRRRSKGLTDGKRCRRDVFNFPLNFPLDITLWEVSGKLSGKLNSAVSPPHSHTWSSHTIANELQGPPLPIHLAP